MRSSLLRRGADALQVVGRHGRQRLVIVVAKIHQVNLGGGRDPLHSAMVTVDVHQVSHGGGRDPLHRSRTRSRQLRKLSKAQAIHFLFFRVPETAFFNSPLHYNKPIAIKPSR